MAPEDQEHMTFITDLGVYFYKVIPFGLKNASATYQRSVNKMFTPQIGRNVEVYVDDMIVKSRVAADHLTDLAETFSTLRRYGLRLNPVKCIFGVSSGRFLGFIVHERGIDVNPKKNPKDFRWTAQCEEALGQIKQHLASLPRLASVTPEEKLSVYLATSQHAAHPIEVITDQPLRQVLSKFDVTGRLLKWSIELEEFDIRYVPRTAIKAQSVADFIAELVEDGNGSSEQSEEAWDLHVDGSATSSSAGAWLVLLAPDGRSFERSFRFGFRATNNEAEYEAPLVGLKLALEMQVDAIHVFTDSQLIAEQLSGGYEAREPTMTKYLVEVKSLASNFSHFTISRVPRSQNERADELAKMASGPDHGNCPEVKELPFRAISVSAITPAEARATWV
uniref:Uncharacterized protein n=1 Tax=Musa acuminata subsp. malaccensis TaxID=214687 RepID=A0A804J2P7_MUSAM|nr:PREDICTED: uncharacterized protein LOC103984818 [Musa acuminata subsp. malaccensis]